MPRIIDFVNVNWDAAVDKDNRRMSIGVIMRDQKGKVLAMLIASKPHIISPAVAKAMTALRVVVFAR